MQLYNTHYYLLLYHLSCVLYNYGHIKNAHHCCEKNILYYLKKNGTEKPNRKNNISIHSSYKMCAFLYEKAIHETKPFFISQKKKQQKSVRYYYQRAHVFEFVLLNNFILKLVLCVLRHKPSFCTFWTENISRVRNESFSD